MKHALNYDFIPVVCSSLVPSLSELFALMILMFSTLYSAFSSLINVICHILRAALGQSYFVNLKIIVE